MNKIKQKLYTSPEVEVVETQLQAAICQQSSSETTIADMPETEMEITF